SPETNTHSAHRSLAAQHLSPFDSVSCCTLWDPDAPLILAQAALGMDIGLFPSFSFWLAPLYSLLVSFSNQSSKSNGYVPSASWTSFPEQGGLNTQSICISVLPRSRCFS